MLAIVIEFLLKARCAIKRSFLSVIAIALYPSISYNEIAGPVAFRTNPNLDIVFDTMAKQKIIDFKLKSRLHDMAVVCGEVSVWLQASFLKELGIRTILVSGGIGMAIRQFAKFNSGWCMAKIIGYLPDLLNQTLFVKAFPSAIPLWTIQSGLLKQVFVTTKELINDSRGKSSRMMGKFNKQWHSTKYLGHLPKRFNQVFFSRAMLSWIAKLIDQTVPAAMVNNVRILTQSAVVNYVRVSAKFVFNSLDVVKEYLASNDTLVDLEAGSYQGFVPGTENILDRADTWFKTAGFPPFFLGCVSKDCGLLFKQFKYLVHFTSVSLYCNLGQTRSQVRGFTL